ncbi:hypothetical protein NMY22_g10527 [Coprinellus aureogranulatus]|nr:hypothetical protein NMY22_g10527 [Coprinellus aureogranulatus]
MDSEGTASELCRAELQPNSEERVHYLSTVLGDAVRNVEADEAGHTPLHMNSTLTPHPYSSRKSRRVGLGPSPPSLISVLEADEHVVKETGTIRCRPEGSQPLRTAIQVPARKTWSRNDQSVVDAQRKKGMFGSIGKLMHMGIFNSKKKKGLDYLDLDAKGVQLALSSQEANPRAHLPTPSLSSSSSSSFITSVSRCKSECNAITGRAAARAKLWRPSGPVSHSSIRDASALQALAAPSSHSDDQMAEDTVAPLSSPNQVHLRPPTPATFAAETSCTPSRLPSDLIGQTVDNRTNPSLIIGRRGLRPQIPPALISETGSLPTHPAHIAYAGDTEMSHTSVRSPRPHIHAADMRPYQVQSIRERFLEVSKNSAVEHYLEHAQAVEQERLNPGSVKDRTLLLGPSDCPTCTREASLVVFGDDMKNGAAQRL